MSSIRAHCRETPYLLSCNPCSRHFEPLEKEPLSVFMLLHRLNGWMDRQVGGSRPSGGTFAFDNETRNIVAGWRHFKSQTAWSLAQRYVDFIADGGYKTPAGCPRAGAVVESPIAGKMPACWIAPKTPARPPGWQVFELPGQPMDLGAPSESN